MTTEEIKQQVTMPDLMRSKGIKINHNNMCSCPFHKDRKPSMKVYLNGANCFSCGWNGDIFKFVQDFENCDFKTAFISLGGTYKESISDVSKRLTKAKFEQSKQERERKHKAENDFYKELDYCRQASIKLAEILEPMSDDWVYFTNQKAFLNYAFEMKYVRGEEIDEINVLGICRQVRHQIDILARTDG